MYTLFPAEPRFPEGFCYYEDFISLAEEQQLLNAISKTELHTFRFQGYEAKRKVASFGYDWSFKKKPCQKEKKSRKNFSH